MATEQTAIVLKLLNGPQAGAQLALSDGSLVVGSSDHDDVVLQDASVAPRHALLTVADGEVRVTAQDGPVATSVAVLAPGERQLLTGAAVIGIGDLRIGIGAADTDWATLGPVASPQAQSEASDVGARPDAEARPGNQPGATGRGVVAGGAAARPWWSRKPAVVGAAVGAALLAMLAVVWALWPRAPQVSPQQEVANRLAQARQLITQSPCPQVVASTRDGKLELSGLCAHTNGLERLMDALSKAGLQADSQVHVIAEMRRGVRDTLARLDGGDLSFTLSDDGALTVSGFYGGTLVAPELSTELRGDVAGITSVDLKVRTMDEARQQLLQILTRSGLNGMLRVKSSAGQLVVDTVEQAAVTQAQWEAVAAAFDKLTGGAPPLQADFAFAPPPEPAEQGPAEAAAPTKAEDGEAPQLSVTAIVVVKGQDAFAVLKGIGAVRVGDKVSGGFVVTEIEPEYVVLTSSAGKRILRLRG